MDLARSEESKRIKFYRQMVLLLEWAARKLSGNIYWKKMKQTKMIELTSKRSLAIDSNTSLVQRKYFENNSKTITVQNEIDIRFA